MKTRLAISFAAIGALICGCVSQLPWVEDFTGASINIHVRRTTPDEFAKFSTPYRLQLCLKELPPCDWHTLSNARLFVHTGKTNTVWVFPGPYVGHDLPYRHPSGEVEIIHPSMQNVVTGELSIAVFETDSTLTVDVQCHLTKFPIRESCFGGGTFSMPWAPDNQESNITLNVIAAGAAKR